MDAAPLNPTVLLGDCREVLADQAISCVDLAYLDPPFNTGRRHTGRSGAYDDSFSDITAYLDFMRARLTLVIQSLQPDGALLLHCDWRTSHRLRVLLDELLGDQCFVNHLIWSYGLGGSSPRRFARKHDDILFYARSDSYYFDPPMVPARSNRMRGQLKKASDVIDIPAINNMATERVGYPSQKPLALLELLIGACCRPGGLVLDPFCGSGTTLVAAERMGRRSIGIDINPEAIKTVRHRCRTATPLLDPA
jgi:DNA modification methylase